MTKPTILFILHLPPPVHGAAMVGKYIHDSHVINDAFECHYINLTTAHDLSDIGKIGFRKLRLFIELLQKIHKEVKSLKPQLVYVTPNACGGAFYKDFVVVQLLKLMGCRIVVHYHNKGVVRRQNNVLDNFLYHRFFKDIKVILLAKALYSDVVKFVSMDDVYICPNGIPETLHTEPFAERTNEIPHLLFLSNLLESKGVLVLLDACKILKDKGYEFVCDFVGGETAEINTQRFTCEIEKRDLDGIAIYHGRKYGEKKESFLHNADIFVFPTFYNNECFPLVLLEAMQHSKACISTNEGGVPDVVKDGENGLICKKQDALSLSDCIARLLDDKDLRLKMGEDGYKKFEQCFTLSAFENKMKEIFADLTKVKRQ